MTALHVAAFYGESDATSKFSWQMTQKFYLWYFLFLGELMRHIPAHVKSEPPLSPALSIAKVRLVYDSIYVANKAI